MPKFVVEADGYSIEFWDQNGLKYKNITLKPTENHRDMFKKAKKERKHYKTCIAKKGYFRETENDAVMEKVMNIRHA